MAGPTLGRPLVDRIKGAEQHHMKELRPGSAGGGEIRILFVFDPMRRAVLLVAGDKAGDWQGWTTTTFRWPRSATRTISPRSTPGSTNEQCQLGGDQAQGAGASYRGGPACAHGGGEAGGHGSAGR
ncbi:type II toxin-antitoxin system RelE/ParE family toxin [Streptomyces sp. NBC_01423]|uniref:type II toxin-antitoxin system RelE/ParE family toxin n=1 Tax=Streptomyces sp. NBC_01423 TaxID=2903860 RepID=UPI003FCE16E6